MGPRQMLSQNLRDTVFHDGWQAPQEVEAGKEGGLPSPRRPSEHTWLRGVKGGFAAAMGEGGG